MSPKYPDLYEASISELQNGLDGGLFNSVDLVKAYLGRIEQVNHQGPKLNAILETNPNALRQAVELDEERRVKGKRGPLHGIPIVLKDNIATMHEEGMNTTAGSYALLGSVVSSDAFVSAKLRAAGAILLGKADLSEWGNFRGVVPSGYSGIGGLTTNPYVKNGTTSGSSSGSAVSVAIGLAAGSLGTETDGSIVSPSACCNVVGLKPTVGLTSRSGVIPICYHQDSIGPICRTVSDCAAILTAIAGKDSKDELTLLQPLIAEDYLQACRLGALKGARLGVPTSLYGDNQTPELLDEFEKAVEVLKKLGAEIVDPVTHSTYPEIVESKDERTVMLAELKDGMNKYLSELVSCPTGVKTLADLIKFNVDNADKELVSPYYEDQSHFINAEKTDINDPSYWQALKRNQTLGRVGIDAVLAEYKLDALLSPGFSKLVKAAAIAGYPAISVPMGFYPPNTVQFPPEPKPTIWRAHGMPMGLTFVGPAWSENRLLGFAYAFEQESRARLRRRAYEEAMPTVQLQDIILEN